MLLKTANDLDAFICGHGVNTMHSENRNVLRSHSSEILTDVPYT